MSECYEDCPCETNTARLLAKQEAEKIVEKELARKIEQGFTPRSIKREARLQRLRDKRRKP